MTKPTIDKSLERFVDMVANPVPFDPITYKDKTDGWIDFTIPLKNLKMTDVITRVVEFEERKNGKYLTERYAVLEIKTKDKRISGEEWYLFNRIATESGSFSSYAFSQLMERIQDLTGYNTTAIKDMVTPYKSHKDHDGKWVYMDEVDKALSIINEGLSKSPDEMVLRLNPETSTIEAVVTEKYVPVTNKEALTLLQAEVGDFNIVREFHDPRRSLFQVQPDCFSKYSGAEDYGIFIENSSTGANRFGLGLFVITSVCSNGMMLTTSKYDEKELGYLARKHTGDKNKIINFIQDGLAKVGKLVEVTYDRIEKAKEKPLFYEKYTHKEVIDALLTPMNVSKKTTKRVTTLLEEKYQEDTVWDFISAITEAAQDVPVSHREHVEKAAGNLLEVLVSSV